MEEIISHWDTMRDEVTNNDTSKATYIDYLLEERCQELMLMILP
jgi:hypothetical protein